MDDQPGSHDSISGHFSFHQENRFSPYDPLNDFTNLPGYGSFTQNRGQNLGLSWTRMFNPRWLNEFRFGFNRLRARVLQEHHGQNKSKELGFPNVLTNPVNLGFPNVDLLGFDGIGEPINYPQERVHNIFHFADNMAWSRGGAHSLKMGADIRKVHLDSYLDFLSRGEWFFLGGFRGTPAVALIQLLSGLPDYAIAVKGNTESGLRTKSLSFYFQDDVRIVKRFTLNLGIRYEYNSPPTEVENRFSIPDLSSKSITCTPQPECQFIPVGESGAAYQPDRNNLAPRIGFALRPLSTTRFVLRGSYGIFYDAGILNLNIFPRMNPPFFQVYFFPNTGRSTIQTILSQSGSAVVQPNMIAPDYRDGYMQHRYFGAQYELQPNWVLDVAYSGSKGTHLTGTRDLNQPQPGIGIGQYPQFNSILLIESRASSSYNALLVRSERRFSRGIAFLAAYTFSKSIDDSSAIFGGGVDPGIPQNSLNVRAERGLSDYHAKHRVVASYIYDLPFGKGRRWLGRPTTINRLLGNWRATGIVTFQTGHPFTVNRGTTASRTAITAFGIPDRPNLVADPYVAGPVPNHPDPLCRKTRSQGGRAADQVYEAESWFNPCAFSNPGLGNFGNAGRNIMISPDYKNFDFAIMKDFRLPGDKKLVQVRAEAFNLFNHPNFDAPNRNFDSSRFGELFSANTYGNKPPRQIQLGLKFVF
jgi:hypothetical protein